MLRLLYFADPANPEVVEDEPKKIEDGPEGETSLQLLQAIYRDKNPRGLGDHGHEHEWEELC